MAPMSRSWRTSMTTCPYRKAQIRALAARLCTVVEAQLPTVDTWTRIEFDWERRDDFLPEQFTSVRVIRPSSHDRSYWNGADAGYLAPLTVTEMQGAIDSKSAADYRLAGAESWLLVVADSRRISSSFDIPDDVAKHPYRTRFDRLFLLDTFPNRVFELSRDAA